MSQTNRPAIPKTLVTSAARTTSSNSGNLKDTSTDFAAMGKTVALTFQVTAYTIGGALSSTGSANFYVDTSMDGGTTWVTAAVPMRVTTSTAERTVIFRNGVADGINSIDSIKGVRPINTSTSDIPTLFPLTQDKRIRWELGDGSTGGNAISVTFAVYAFSDPS